MCQAIPRPVLAVTAERAHVLIDGQETWVDRRAVPELAVGDYVVVYAGVALEMLAFYEELEGLLAESTERLPDHAVILNDVKDLPDQTS
jgi:hydrogenase assembly chaperone HypC/HupF